MRLPEPFAMLMSSVATREEVEEVKQRSSHHNVECRSSGMYRKACDLSEGKSWRIFGMQLDTSVCQEDVIFTKIEEGYKQGGTRRRRMSATHSQFTPFRKQLDRDRAGVAAKNLGPWS